jgi:DNA-binding Lrp family transcriptional regulator
MPTVKGYILIKLVPGFEEEALSRIRATPGVVEVSPLFGHWDAIAIGEAQSLHALSMLVVKQIRGMQGVEQTETLLQGEF